MMTFFGPLLAAVVLGQAHTDRTFAASVVDDEGKPVAGADVVFYCPTPLDMSKPPAEVRVTTSADGQFRLAVPAVDRLPIFRARFWAFRPGLALVAVGFDELAKPYLEQVHRYRRTLGA